MACHRSHHHLHSHHQPCSCCCSCSCGLCAPSCCSSSPHPTTTASSDPLLQAIAAHLLQSQPATPQPVYHFCNQQYPKPKYPHHHPQHRQQQHLKYHYQHQQEPQAQNLVQSLLHRIAALESTLPQLSSRPPPPAATLKPPPPRKLQPSPPMSPAAPRLSIRDLAARTIQARFRLYLVRRSQTLRHLKHLASVRSHIAALKSSLSDEARLNPKVLSQKATDLLLQVDSIQSTDPMIREGKRSISRELVRLLEFADQVSAKRHELFIESIATAHKNIDPSAFAEEPIPGVEEHAGVSTASSEDDEELDVGNPEAHASTSKTAKRVSFAEDVKMHRVSNSAEVPFTEEETTDRGGAGVLSDDHWRPSLKEPSRREAGGGGFCHTSDDEKSPRSRHKAGTRPAMNGWPSEEQNGSHSLGLSAPVPLQMEARRGDSKKKKKNTMVV